MTNYAPILSSEVRLSRLSITENQLEIKIRLRYSMIRNGENQIFVCLNSIQKLLS
jgi:hypothetical protein